MMKVLFVTPYLYSEELPGFQRNRTGFGILLEQMAEHIGSRCELSVFSNVITPEARCHEARSSHTPGATCSAARDARGCLRASARFSGRPPSLRPSAHRLLPDELRRAAPRHRGVAARPYSLSRHRYGYAPVLRCVPGKRRAHGDDAPRADCTAVTGFEGRCHVRDHLSSRGGCGALAGIAHQQRHQKAPVP